MLKSIFEYLLVMTFILAGQIEPLQKEIAELQSRLKEAQDRLYEINEKVWVGLLFRYLLG